MKIAYVIGRFQPFHKGHKAMVDKALEIADKVVVIIGDTGCKPTFRDPWNVCERKMFIQACYDAPELERLSFVSVEDQPYDDKAWSDSVRAAVKEATEAADPRNSEKFLIGFKKDASSFYLEMFPEWQFVEVEPFMNIHTAGPAVISATKIRESYFGMTVGVWNWKYHVTDSVEEQLRDFFKNDYESYNRIRDEYAAIKKFDREWDCEAVRKWGLVQVAVDALLFSNESVLLIRRGGGVGKGSLALPGGFVSPGERLVDAALRELHEETGVKIDSGRFSGFRVGGLVPFDYPGRSMRGRIVTNVLPIYCPDHFESEPEVTPGDDAQEAMWVPRSSLRSLKREFFADHFHIINSIIAI